MSAKKDNERFEAIYTTVFKDGDDVANEDAKFLIRQIIRLNEVGASTRFATSKTNAQKLK